MFSATPHPTPPAPQDAQMQVGLMRTLDIWLSALPPPPNNIKNTWVHPSPPPSPHTINHRTRRCRLG